MRRFSLTISLLALLALLLASCVTTAPTPTPTSVRSETPPSTGVPLTPTPSANAAPAGTTPAPAARLLVVTSLPVFASLVQAVGGDLVEVSALLPPGTDPHTYQPSPRDVEKLARAQLVVYNGGDLDPWMARQIEAAASGSRVLALAEGLQPPPQVAHEEEAIQGTPVEDHEHTVNPHFWLDPDYAITYVQRIAAALEELDPAHADTYRANAERYIADIRTFDAWARQQIATIPPERRKLVTFHDAFPYFAAHYGLELVGVVVLSPGREPSPQEIARLVERIRSEGVPAIFVEPQFNPKLAETIAREAGVKVLTLYSDAAPAGMDYLAMMRANVTNVVEGLRG